MLRESILHTLRESILGVRAWLLGWGEAGEPVRRKHHRKRTRFYFPGEGSQRRKRLMIVSGVLLAAVFVFSAGNLVGYAVEYLGARSASEALRQAYYEEDTAISGTPEVSAANAPGQGTSAVVGDGLTERASLLPSSPAEETVALPTATPAARLQKLPYPDNPYAITSSRFQKLRRQNEDIIGWLSIEALVDEAVVQRDNTYYLDRDYRGYHNKNGAIFLDENCDLRTRPYTLMLYGHNMKTGLMFGGLRNYENPTFYHKNPFITFDTAYEEGRYVIFAVATVSTDATNWRYVNFSWLLSSTVSLRTQAIAALHRFSVYREGIDVQPEDQILLLVTCVDDADDRRIVAARRIREDETEAALLQKVKAIRKK